MNGLMGIGGNENFTFSHLQSEEESSPSVVLHQLLQELRWTVTHSTVIAHQLRSAVAMTLRISAAQNTINCKAATNWQNISNRMGMGAGGNGNNQCEWEVNEPLGMGENGIEKHILAHL